MKENQLRHLFLIGVISTLVGCSCNPKEDMSATPPAPPQSSSEDKVPCNEDECDETEAGEEAKVHVIEIDTPKEEKSAAAEPAPVKSEAQEAVEAKVQSSSESAERKVETPSMNEEPTTQLFESLPSTPVSENTVVLSL